MGYRPVDTDVHPATTAADLDSFSSDLAMLAAKSRAPTGNTGGAHFLLELICLDHMAGAHRLHLFHPALELIHLPLHLFLHLFIQYG